MLNSRFLGLAAALAVFSACADGPLESDPLDTRLVAVTDRTVKMVPFEATVVLRPTDDLGVVCPVGEGAFQQLIEGRGSHLGKLTGEFRGCAGFFSGTFSIFSFTFIAANGDEVRTQMDPSFPGQFIVFGGPGNPAVIVGGLNIVGGTGRFEGATGHLTTRTEGIFGDPGNNVTIGTGSISSPGSIKWDN